MPEPDRLARSAKGPSGGPLRESLKLLSPKSRHFRSYLSIALILSLAFCLVYGPGPTGISSTLRPQTDDSLRFDLPANGNLRVENLRGGIIVDVWKQNYVAISAIND